MQKTTQAQRTPEHIDDGLGTKKTIFVLCVVVGCVGILWPKLFYPMFYGSIVSPPQNRASGEFKPNLTLQTYDFVVS